MQKIPYTELSAVLNAMLVGKTEGFATAVFTDSRMAAPDTNALFFALVGENHDGHRYITELYSKGIKGFVVSSKGDWANQYPNATFLVVANTLQALQNLATHHRQQFNYPVVGITGSNGKTIVKEWLAQLLGSDFNVVRSPKSYNSQLGVPLSVLQMSNSNNLAIFEAGISKRGEMERLQPIILPTIGIFTNIGLAHQENFNTLAEKASEKMKLFDLSNTLIYCKDYPEIQLLATEYATRKPIKLFCWSKNGQADVQLVSKSFRASRTALSIKHKDITRSIEIPFADEASVENAMHCIAAMLLLGFNFETIEKRLGDLHPVAMRLELKEGTNSCTIINDSYNSDLGSLSIALDYLSQQRQHPKKVLILSDILQSGQALESLYTEVAQLLKSKGVNQFIGIGSEISKHHSIFPLGSEFYLNTGGFIESYRRGLFNNAAILLKGSRAFRFERISALLEQKSHRTILEINLNALTSNLNYFRSLLKPRVKVMAMVKAYSYGSGSHEIANLLQFHRVDYLGVAFTDEGIALREAGITLPIVVLNPTFDSYELMIEYNLEPEVYGFSNLHSVMEAARRLGVSHYPIHIKIDSGMHRLGFAESDIPELANKLSEASSVRAQSIFSHLAATDDSSLDSFTLSQIEVFERVSQQVTEAIGYMPIRHILNSGGIERFPLAQFDMVRLGIGLYGVSAVHSPNLQVVNSLKTYIIQIRHLPAGETVGYNRSGLLSRPSTIATIPIGYADGLNRRLSKGVGSVMVNGEHAPIVGNVSMDTCTIDITDILGVQEGDEVTVFGQSPSITDIAEKLGTIPYEVLTSVSRRVKRVYVQE